MTYLKRFSIFCLFAITLLVSSGALAQNSLSRKEKKQGWIMLFDGSSLDNWKGYNQNDIPSGWKITDGELVFSPGTEVTHNAEDLLTKEDYQDFDLSLEWKISPGGNSGILYNVIEDTRYEAPYNTGPEMQILDNDHYRGGHGIKQRTGDLYELIQSSSEPMKPVGEWNHAEVISRNAHYQFFLNGVKIVEYDMHTPAWDAMVSTSKFKRWADFGRATKGKICLQAHGHQVSFRAIKIRKLS